MNFPKNKTFLKYLTPFNLTKANYKSFIADLTITITTVFEDKFYLKNITYSHFMTGAYYKPSNFPWNK